MINLKNIQQIYINENYPKKWDDLNWETPDICDPRYLYSIYQAMIERNYLDRIKPTFKQDNLISKVHSDFFNFRNDVPFRFRYFQIIYAWVIGNMQFFLNPDGFERSVKFEDGKSILTTENMRYNDSEMSAILGYDYRELPKPFQPFPYYNKFLIGMKNAIHSMKWIYWPMVITGSSPTSSESYGGYDVNPDDPNDLYNFHDGSLAEAFNSNITSCQRYWNRRKEIIVDGVLYNTAIKTKNYIKRKNDDGDWVLKGTYFSYEVSGVTGNDVWLAANFKWMYDTTIKTFYVPTYKYGSNITFKDNDTYRSYFLTDTFGKTARLWSEETVEAGKRFISSKKFQVSYDDIILPTENYPFPDNTDAQYDSSSVSYVNQINAFFFGMLDASSGCAWK